MQFSLVFRIQTPRRLVGKHYGGKARATATRCFSPPESSLGLCEALSDSPMKSSNSCARALASLVEAGPMYAGIITFSSAVNSGNN